MTAPELIQRIEAAGGVLTVSGDLIQYKLPEDAVSMVEGLRRHRTEVIRVLREREPLSEAAKATSLSDADSSQLPDKSQSDLYASCWRTRYSVLPRQCQEV